ncbi:hypothetical protein [Streptomyces sp. FH025]|uniref:hypothetical protein n=1 Tax=Streptomyces sp. FH025 TaxID=2815937 RepID=UPI001A9D39C5|nr:hypothetical protein [Streptomyces sp. FH025]MBO1418770.1 hypothetical protein [Streptomyces sp. FH025]
MTWLRVLTALGILAVAASALLVFALCTATSRSERSDEQAPPDLRKDGLRKDAERSGLFQRMGGDG